MASKARTRGRLTKTVIVQALATLADRSWPQEVSQLELAHHLEVRPPSLYNHFSGQGELNSELAAFGLVQLTESLRAVAVGRSGRDALWEVATAYRDFAKRRPGLYWATVRPASLDFSSYREARQALLDLLLQVLRGIPLEGESAVHAMRTLRSALHGFVSLEAMGSFQMPVEPDKSYLWMLRALLDSIIAEGP